MEDKLLYLKCYKISDVSVIFFIFRKCSIRLSDDFLVRIITLLLL